VSVLAACTDVVPWRCSWRGRKRKRRESQPPSASKLKVTVPCQLGIVLTFAACGGEGRKVAAVELHQTSSNETELLAEDEDGDKGLRVPPPRTTQVRAIAAVGGLSQGYLFGERFPDLYTATNFAAVLYSLTVPPPASSLCSVIRRPSRSHRIRWAKNDARRVSSRAIFASKTAAHHLTLQRRRAERRSS
jgi:hypothetical protein